jgi:hypothetical protein
MKSGPSRPKLSLRINGTRIGDAARPEVTDVPAPIRTLRRPVPALVIRDYRDEDTGAGS